MYFATKHIGDLAMKINRLPSFFRDLKFNIYRRIILPFKDVPSAHSFIFIVGCYNSGTTLLNALLGNHEEISMLHTEGASLTDQIHRPEDFGWNRMWHMCRDKLEIDRIERKPNAQRLKKEWAFWFDSSKKYWLEKSVVNSLNIDWLERHFDHPHFIWIVRNGYAVSEGIQRRTKPEGKHPPHYPEGYPIKMCAKQWVVNNQVIEQKISFVQNYIKVTYEDLTDDPERTMQRIIDWLPVQNKYIEVPKEFKFHKKTAEIKNMNEASIKQLTVNQIATINSVAHHMLKHHGYLEL